MLGGVLQKAETGRRAADYMQAAIEKNRSKLEAYENFCAELGAEPAHVALAWLLCNPVVTAPIVGPRTLSQLDDTMRAFDIHLSQASLDQLDNIFPGPGGPAPEAYAW